MEKVRVLVVNQAKLICNLLTVVLREEPDMEVVGHATAVAEGLALVEKSDIVLVDAGLPDDGALTLVAEVNRKKLGTHVLISGVEKSPKTILKYIEAGADGYILKEFTVSELLAQIRALPQGKALADPEIVAQLMERLSELADLCADHENVQRGLAGLSDRENEVLDLLSEGKSNREIGDALHIELGTVKNHVHNILTKLGVSSRHQAAKVHEQNQEEV